MQSLQRGLGSIDIAAAVRSVMFIGKLKHDPTMRILTHEKSSLAPPGVSLAFSLGDEGGFRWVGEYDITADEMLSGIEPQRETKTQQAKDLICTLLAGGKQVLSEDIDKAALERGRNGLSVSAHWASATARTRSRQCWRKRQSTSRTRRSRRRSSPSSCWWTFKGK